MPRLRDFPRSLSEPLTPQDSSGSPVFERTELDKGTWLIFVYRGTITKDQIRQYFQDVLGLDLPDTRISLSRNKFVLSISNAMFSDIFAWILESPEIKNPCCIKVSHPRE